MPNLSIVVPSHNESKQLNNSIRVLSRELDNISGDHEIFIIIDGGDDSNRIPSKFETPENIELRFVYNEVNKGKGYCLRRGMKLANGDYILFVDADLPVNMRSFRCCVGVLTKQNADVVIGDRKLVDSRKIGHSHTRRVVNSRITNFAVQFFLLPGYFDTQCPLKGFSRAVIERIVNICRVDGYAIDAELLYQCTRAGYKIHRIPVTWADIRAKTPMLKLTWLLFVFFKEIVKLRFFPIKHFG